MKKDWIDGIEDALMAAGWAVEESLRSQSSAKFGDAATRWVLTGITLMGTATQMVNALKAARALARAGVIAYSDDAYRMICPGCGENARPDMRVAAVIEHVDNCPVPPFLAAFAEDSK